MQRLRLLSLLHRCAPAIAFLILYLPICAYAATGAAIRLPDEFAATAQKIEFAGFGGFNRGEYTGGEYSGSFTRIESRLGIFDPLYVSNRGKSSFSLEGLPELQSLTADCRARQNVGTVRVVTLDLKKLTYACEFSGPAVTPAWRFVLGEPRREGFREKLLARQRRRGEALILEHEILIESVHEYAGSRLSSPTPLGYLLESNGAIVAAVDLLDWNPIVHLRDGLDQSTRRAAVIVALALSVLRDPANSTLEDSL